MFINYRSVDSQSYGALLYTDLVRRFGDDMVFLDSESIPAGEDYVQELLNRVRSAGVVLAVIGPRWLTATGAADQRAIDIPSDWIRRELSEAFAAGVRVIPVLIDDATLPASDELPGDIASLSRCQARHLRRREPTSDLDRIARDLIALHPELVSAAGVISGSVTGQQLMVNKLARDVSGTSIQAGAVSGGLHVHLPGPAQGAVPAAAGNVRRLPVDTGIFVGRANELTRLTEATGSSDRVVVVAVNGLGGVGKSTLVARFAEQHIDEYSPVWWITADSMTTINAGLAEFATALNQTVAGLPAEQRTEHAMEWLASNTGWLLILDNLSTSADVDSLLERVRTGTILITTRQRNGWRGITTVSLDVLAPADAVELLNRIVLADWHEADLDGADRLCAELGWLPLAIEQAAAYIAQTRITPVRYLDLLAQFPARMFTATAEGGNAQHTMARVWRVTLDRLASTPSAGHLLRILAWYASDNIPRAILDSVFAEPDLLDAMGRLAAYSMITLTAETISVHRLVQAVARTADEADPHRGSEDIASARDAAIAALANAVNELDHRTPSSWPTYHAIQPHARALFDYVALGSDDEMLCLLFIRVGVFIDSQGGGATAIAYLNRAAEGLERLHGRDHWATLDALINLANAYYAMGDLGRAIPLIESSLADSLREYGPDERSTQVLRNNLANAYKSAGRLDRAIPLLEAAVDDRTRLWGSDHPDTLTARNNLANVYHNNEQYVRAIEVHESVMTDRARVLGPDHPATLNSRHNLAHGFQKMRNVDQAISLYDSVIADRSRVLGSDHVDTLGSMLNLANTYKMAGDLMRALRMHKAVLDGYVKVLGVSHPRTLGAKISLANTYKRAGNLGRAIRLYESTFAEHIKILGADHLDTLMAQSGLADAYRANGELKRAIQTYEMCVADRVRVLGSDHPDTLNVRSSLADAYVSINDLARAIPMSESVAADCLRALGPDHHGTLVTQNNLAQAYAAAGDRKRAITLLESVAAACVRVLGLSHPTTVAVHANLAAIVRH